MLSGIAMYDSICSVSYEAEGVKIGGIPFKLKEESPSSVSGKVIDTILGDSLTYSLAQKGNNVNKKFSMTKPVEETKDLIAVQNISEEKLDKIMELGAFPMPSIAITRYMDIKKIRREKNFIFIK